MKHILLSSLLVMALAFTACEQQSGVNDPVSSGTANEVLLKAINSLDLSMAQTGQLAEMFWLQEDLTSLLDPMQISALNTLIDGMSPDFGTAADPRGHGFDMGGLMYLRLILKANPDLTDTEKEVLIQLIKDSAAKRAQLIADNKDNPEVLRELLKAEHEALIAAMNALLTPEQLKNVEDLKAEIEARRQERRELWQQMRIDFQVTMWTKILGLDEAQATSIHELLLAHYAAVQAAIAENGGDLEALREILEQLKADLDAAIQALLTDEQKEIWEKMKTARRDWRGGHHRGGIGPRR
jgi:Spy/CpxP family protein refolding chaperone